MPDAIMQETFTFDELAVPLSLPLSFLIVGLLSLALGLTGLVCGSAILIATFGGEPLLPSHFALGSLITLVATRLGCAMIWPSLVPSKMVDLDAFAQEVRVEYRYPLVIRRDTMVAFTDVRPSEIVWHKVSEYSDGGYCELKVTLPDGAESGAHRIPSAYRNK